MRAYRSFATSLLFLSLVLAPAWGADRPRSVRLGSPAGATVVAVRSECPTFTWGELPEAEGYRLVVYDAGAGSPADRSSPLFEIALPAGLSIFAPTAEHCLQPGNRYGWAVAVTIAGVDRWSEHAFFDVLAAPARDGEPRAADAGDTAAIAPTSILAGEPALTVAATLGGAPGPRSVNGAAFSPPSCSGFFADVDASNPFCGWIEQLARDQITAGCGGGNYCPKAPVTREQWALLLERAMRGTDTFRPGSTTADIPNRSPGATGDVELDSRGRVEEGEHSSIAIGTDGLGLISYYEGSDGGYANPQTGDLKVAHCSDTNCTAATITHLDTLGAVGQFTSLAIGTDGLGLISYHDGTNGDLKVAHCSNVTCTAATITTLDADGYVGQYTSIAIGADGFGLISYYDDSNHQLKVAHCSDTSCTTAVITVLDPNGGVGTFTSIAIGADGRGLISYYDYTNSDLKVAHCSDTNCTTATITSLDTAGDTGQYTSIAIGTDGFGLISYHFASAGDLRVAHCSDTNCTAAVIATLDSPGFENGKFTSIAIGTDGLGLISYYHEDPNTGTHGDLKVAHCSDTNCSTANLSLIDTINNVGLYTSLAIGADGLGLISYYFQTRGSLKVAHCGTTEWCSTGTSNTQVDIDQGVGQHTSITIGVDGLALVSYYNARYGDLEVAHCADTQCTVADTITAIDTAGDVGRYSSLTIGADGLGLISYYDGTNRLLKVAHCANVNCTAATSSWLCAECIGAGAHSSIAIGADGRGLISYYDESLHDLWVAHCASVECAGVDAMTVLDATGDVGQYTSIAIGADGRALISYYDATNRDLKAVHCTNVNCTTADAPVALDATGDFVGQYTSLTIGADGFGLISYFDESNNRLKVAHCSNVDCTGATTTTLDPDYAGQYTSITIGADGLGLISYYRHASLDRKVAHCANPECTAATITWLDTPPRDGRYSSVTIGADGLGLIAYYDEAFRSLKVAHCSNVHCAPYFRRR